MLEEQLRKYADLQEKQKLLDTEMSELKEAIVSEMKTKGVDKFTVDNITASIITKESYKYNDELAMINWCKEHGYTNFIQEKLISTTLNKELKKGPTVLTESLSSMYAKTITEAFKVESK